MKYLYSGPTSGVTLQDGDKAREVMLHANTEVELPADNEYTKTLVALGYLTPMTGEAASKAGKPTATNSKGG